MEKTKKMKRLTKEEQLIEELSCSELDVMKRRARSVSPDRIEEVKGRKKCFER